MQDGGNGGPGRNGGSERIAASATLGARGARPEPRGGAYPAEVLLAVWLVFAAASSAAIRPPDGIPLAVALLLLAGAMFAIGRVPPPLSPDLGRLRALVPLALFPPLYGLTGRLNVGLERWVLDGPIERLEAAIFGGQPSMTLAPALPSLVLSEVLHACYFAYFLLVPLPALVLAGRGRDRVLGRVVATLTAAFLFCGIFYVWLPVTSPLYRYPPLGVPWDRGFFYGLTHATARAGGVVGGAFPSSHAALSTLALLLAWRYERALARLMLLPVAGLLVATVYGRWHFALDTIAGVVVGFAFAALERRTSGKVEVE